MNRRQVLRGFFLLYLLMQILYLTLQLLQVTYVLVLFLKLNPSFLHLFLQIFQLLNFALYAFDFRKVLAFVLLLGLFYFDFLLETFDLFFQVLQLFKVLFIRFRYFGSGVLYVPGFRVEDHIFSFWLLFQLFQFVLLYQLINCAIAALGRTHDISFEDLEVLFVGAIVAGVIFGSAPVGTAHDLFLFLHL